MPWWVWLVIGVVTGGVAAYLWLALYFAGVFRR